ncbi:MAG: DUF3455 domain-containing protein [Janthinobacterium lividum]
MKALVPALLLCLTSLASGAQDVTQPPAETRAVFTVQGVGVQIYACRQTATAYSWTLLAPRADLIDTATNLVVGTHTKGPTWTWSDKSAVTGTVLQQKPTPGNVSWLLLASHSVGEPGSLAGVIYVRRSDTQGGIPSATALCGAGNANALLEVPYRATYTFYTAN